MDSKTGASTFPGRMGAGTQRTVLSDADAVAAVSVCGRQKSGLEEWERLVRQYEAQSSDTPQGTIKAAILAHSPQDPEARHVGLNATRLQGYGTLKNEWKTMHQAYRQCGIADGNDTTPMEVDVLNERQRYGTNEQRQREGQRDESKGQSKEQSRKKEHQTVECEVSSRVST